MRRQFIVPNFLAFMTIQMNNRTPLRMRLAFVAAIAFLCASKLSFAEPPQNWLWKEPEVPVNVTISRAEPGKTALSTNISLRDDGSLVAFYEDSRHGGDTNVTETVIRWFRSLDGGLKWTAIERPLGFPEIESGFSAPPIQISDGSLLTVGSYAWENFPDNARNRERFQNQGHYLYIHGQKSDAEYRKRLEELVSLGPSERFVLTAVLQVPSAGAMTVGMFGRDGGISANCWVQEGGKSAGIACVARDQRGVALPETEVKLTPLPANPIHIRVESDANAMSLSFSADGKAWKHVGSYPRGLISVNELRLHAYSKENQPVRVDSVRLAITKDNTPQRGIASEDFDGNPGDDLSVRGWKCLRGHGQICTRSTIDDGPSGELKGKTNGGTISLSYRAWMKQSHDGGQKWQKSEIAFPRPTPHLCCYGDPILTSSGIFVQPMWGRLDMTQEPVYVSSLVARTSDGDNWEIDRVARRDDFDLNETSITQAPNGDLVAVIRTTLQRDLWTAISKNDGKTWSEPRDTGLRGSTPAVVTTKDGLVVAVYVRRGSTPGAGEFSKSGIYACVSRDSGQTWDTERQVLIHDAQGGVVVGYPKAISVPDGSVFAVYSYQDAMAGTRFHPGHTDFQQPQSP